MPLKHVGTFVLGQGLTTVNETMYYNYINFRNILIKNYFIKMYLNQMLKQFMLINKWKVGLVETAKCKCEIFWWQQKTMTF